MATRTMECQVEATQNPGGAEKVRKRRRPALSCVPCHRRKLKCGREFPTCERCRKTNHAQDCVYRERTGQTSVATGRTSSRSETNNQFLGPALEEEEPARGCGTETKTSLPTPEHSYRGQVEERRETHVQECIIYKGKDFLTKFYGYSYHRNLYQQFDQLRDYIQGLKAQNPNINKLRDEIHLLKINAHNLKSPVDATRIGGDWDLRSLVPTRKVADELLNIYITRFEATHRVVHLPTLLQEYNKHWTGPQADTSILVIQLLLAMATALSLRESLTCDLKVQGSDVISRETAASWIQACEAWMSKHPSRPSQHSWTTLATTCLLVIAKRANHIQGNEFWVNTGALLRSAMAAGYHREPNSMANISVFHREIRRRLWATIIELDLQASAERGMPPSLREEDFNTRPPLNINDNAIEESTRELPTEMPLEYFTETSFQAIAYRSLGLRLRICAFINNSHVKAGESNFHEVLAMDEEIMKALMEIPTTWVSRAADEWRTQRPLYLRTMLDLLLRQQLIMLHMPLAPLSEHHPKFGHSRRARLEAATNILGQFRKLVDHGILPPSGCSNGQFQAALTICHEMYMKDASFATAATLYASPNLAESFIAMAEGVLPMIESRISFLAKGLNEYYVLTMVLGLLKSRLWSERSSSFGAEAVERITKVMITLCSIWTSAGATSDRSTPRADLLSGCISSAVPQHAITVFPESSADGGVGQMDSSMSNEFGFMQDDLDLSVFDIWTDEDNFFGNGVFDYSTATEQHSLGYMQ